jgi:hypothetical protein
MNKGYRVGSEKGQKVREVKKAATSRGRSDFVRSLSSEKKLIIHSSHSPPSNQPTRVCCRFWSVPLLFCTMQVTIWPRLKQEEKKKKKKGKVMRKISPQPPATKVARPMRAAAVCIGRTDGQKVSRNHTSVALFCVFIAICISLGLASRARTQMRMHTSKRGLEFGMSGWMALGLQVKTSRSGCKWAC